MVKRLDSQALGDLNKALGLTGAGATITELTDGVVDQSLTINEIARRGRTQGGTEGLYTAVMRATHVGAGNVTVTVDPYNVGDSAFPPYPPIMPRGFDVWLLQASVREHSGGPSTIGATLSVDFSNDQQGWGEDNGGSRITSSQAHRLGLWDALVNVGTEFATLAGTEQPSIYPKLRIPRGSRPGASTNALVFLSEASAAVNFDCQLLLGVFPSALGQDGVL